MREKKIKKTDILVIDRRRFCTGEGFDTAL